MTTFLQLIVVGLSTGSVFAVVGMSLVLIYRTTGIVNFAQGIFAVLGALLTFQLHRMAAALARRSRGGLSRCRGREPPGRSRLRLQPAHDGAREPDHHAGRIVHRRGGPVARVRRHPTLVSGDLRARLEHRGRPGAAPVRAHRRRRAPRRDRVDALPPPDDRRPGARRLLRLPSRRRARRPQHPFDRGGRVRRRSRRCRRLQGRFSHRATR